MTTRIDKAKQQFNCIKQDLDLILSFRGMIASADTHTRLMTEHSYNSIGTGKPGVSIVADHRLKPTDVIRYVEGTGIDAIRRHAGDHHTDGVDTLSGHLESYMVEFSDLGELVIDNCKIDFNNQLVTVAYDGKTYQFTV